MKDHTGKTDFTSGFKQLNNLKAAKIKPIIEG